MKLKRVFTGYVKKWIHIKGCFIEVKALIYGSVVSVTEDAEGEGNFGLWSQSLGSIVRRYVIKMIKRKRLEKDEEEEEGEESRRGKAEKEEGMFH